MKISQIKWEISVAFFVHYMKEVFYMKKLICIILIVGLCLSSIFFAGAADVSEKGKYEQLFVERLKINLDESGNDVGFYDYKEIYEYYSVSSADETEPDYVLAFAACSYQSPAIAQEIIGEYAVVSYAFYSPYTLGYHIYVPTEDKIYTLEEAYNANIAGIDKAFTESGIHAGLIGDADKNSKINIKDATMLQKHLAKITDPKDYYREYLSEMIVDFNRDEVFNISDATAIQKYLAKIDL